MIQLGIYEHYKGQRYRVLGGIAQHTETSDEFVSYQALYGDQLLWARPISLFHEKVLYGSQEVPRFKFIGNFEEII